MGKIKVKDLTLISLFTALIAVGAFIKIPLLWVPFTLQFLFTVLAGLLLGPYLGGISVFLYIFLGLIGLPIFAGGGGIGYVLKPTFGYLIGFLISTIFIGYMAGPNKKISLTKIIIVNFLGLLIVYSCGMVYFYSISNFIIGKQVSIRFVLWWCFLVFLPSDTFFSVLAAILAKRLKPVLKK